MKIRVKTTDFNSEQMKFLSQLGEFRGENDEAWVASCDPDEFDEAIAWLKWARIEDVLVQFGE